MFDVSCDKWGPTGTTTVDSFEFPMSTTGCGRRVVTVDDPGRRSPGGVDPTNDG